MIRAFMTSLAVKKEVEVNMPSPAARPFRIGAVAFAFWCLVNFSSRAEEQDTAALAAAMKDARVTLEQGLGTTAKDGRPISAKFEIDEGKLQLSVYVESANGFKEVVLNPQSGAAKPPTRITGGDDLEDAQKQNTAMAVAKTTLVAAAQHAVATNTGARAISVYPEIQNGHPIAVVTLLRGDGLTKAAEKLD